MAFIRKKQYWLNLYKRNTQNTFLKTNMSNNLGKKITWCTANCEYNPKLFDKISAKNEVAKILGTNKYIIPTYQIAKDLQDINWNDLIGKSFVIKPNNQSCSNGVIIQNTNLKKKDIDALKKICANNKYLSQCNNIMIEKFVGSKNSKTPYQTDYKFWCFNGKPFCCELQNNDKNIHSSRFYNLNWKPLPLWKTYYKHMEKKYRKPKYLSQMIKIVEKISKNMPVVRVDMYNINNKIYFGECQKIYSYHCQFENANDNQKLSYLMDLKNIPADVANLNNRNYEVKISQHTKEAQKLLQCPDENFEFIFSTDNLPVYFDNRNKDVGIFNFNNFWYQCSDIHNVKVDDPNNKIYNKKYSRFENLRISEAKNQLNIYYNENLGYQYDPEGDIVYFDKNNENIGIKYENGEWKKTEYATIKMTTKMNNTLIKNMQVLRKARDLFQPVCDKLHAGECTPHDITSFFQHLRQLTSL